MGRLLLIIPPMLAAIASGTVFGLHEPMVEYAENVRERMWTSPPLTVIACGPPPIVHASFQEPNLDRIFVIAGDEATSASLQPYLSGATPVLKLEDLAGDESLWGSTVLAWDGRTSDTRLLAVEIDGQGEARVKGTKPLGKPLSGILPFWKVEAIFSDTVLITDRRTRETWMMEVTMDDVTTRTLPQKPAPVPVRLIEREGIESFSLEWSSVYPRGQGSQK
ncbi:MAG: hypothetical protein RLY93_07375 [Sumerlaeia bacterium]